jgi:hypothetical protein
MAMATEVSYLACSITYTSLRIHGLERKNKTKGVKYDL